MTLDPEKITSLIAQLGKEYQVIEENWDLNRRAWERIHQGADDILDWSALGYTLHVVYTSMEELQTLLKRVKVSPGSRIEKRLNLVNANILETGEEIPEYSWRT